MLRDLSDRVVDVYVPARHDGHGLPLLVDLVGYWDAAVRLYQDALELQRKAAEVLEGEAVEVESQGD